jgi:signal transduction histidine kinase
MNPWQKRPLRVLVVENSPDDYEILVDHLEQSGFVVTAERIQNRNELVHALDQGIWEAVISDFMLDGFTALDTLRIVQAAGLEVPFIVVSGSVGEDLAVDAMRAGAHDYLMKDRLARLGAALDRELKESANRRERKRIEEENRRQAEELQANAEKLARANEELEQINARLARSNLELERFAYLAAHDLQEPLRMVTAHSELLVRRYRSKLDPDVDRILSFVQNGAERMESLIRGFLAYSEALHDDEPRLKAVPLEQVVQEALDEEAQAVQSSGAQVTRVGPLPSVWADAGRLRLVFRHLLSNAIKFSKPDQKPQIRIAAEERSTEVLVRVTDKGIGIDPRYAEQVFGLFKRLHRDDASGLGIGLALCRQIVEQHGGRLWVESALGLGATFQFTLKLASVAASQRAGA